MTEELNANDNGNEPADDPSMADAFDFDVPDGDLDDLSDLGDDDNSAQDTGDDKNSAGDKEDDSDKDAKAKEDPIDPKLLVRIGRMGLSDEETDRVLGLGNSKAIADMLDLLESRNANSEGDGNEQEKPEWFEFSDEAADDIAPELVEMLKSMNSSTRKAVEQMVGNVVKAYEGRIKEMGQTLAEQNMDAFDDAVESLGKDWQPVFGKEGKTDDGHERNLERLRKAVFSDSYKGSVAKRVKTAVSDMFVEHSKKLANDANVQKARDRQGRFIGKPAQRNQTNADMSPRQRAVANASKFMKERNMHPEQIESVDFTEAL